MRSPMPIAPNKGSGYHAFTKQRAETRATCGLSFRLLLRRIHGDAMNHAQDERRARMLEKVRKLLNMARDGRGNYATAYYRIIGTDAPFEILTTTHRYETIGRLVR